MPEAVKAAAPRLTVGQTGAGTVRLRIDCPQPPVGSGASLPFGTPSPCTLQGTAANLFGNASTPTLPYSLVPFTSPGPIFAPGAQAAVATGTLKFAGDTNAQNITETQIGKAQAV